MNVEELRIGSLIKEAGSESNSVVVVKSIIEMGISYGSMNYYINEQLPLDHYEGVPLTDDWMRKAQFENQQTILLNLWAKDISVFRGKEFKNLIVDLRQGIAIRQGDLQKDRMEDDLISIHNIDMQGPLYIHNLQSIFYSLTGKPIVFIK